MPRCLYSEAMVTCNNTRFIRRRRAEKKITYLLFFLGLSFGGSNRTVKPRFNAVTWKAY